MLNVFTFKSGRALRAIALVIAAGGMLAACQGYGGKTAASPEAVSSSGQSPSFILPVQVNGRYARIDQNARLLVPFGKNDLSGSFGNDTAVLVNKKGQWQLLDGKTQAVIKKFDGNVYDTGSPDYFVFSQDDKSGLMDYHGNVVQSPRFNDMDPGYSVVDGKSAGMSFIAFLMGDKSGVLDIHGKQLTDAVYDTIPLPYVSGDLLIAQKGKQNWLINLADGTQQPVPYGEPVLTAVQGDHTVSYYSPFAMADGHMVVFSTAHPDKYGLVDSRGHLVIPMNYDKLGTPSDGLLAFWQKNLCGYMDYQGKVAIPAQFGDCKPFGKKSALAAAPDDTRASHGKYGLIDHAGAWLIQPTYDKAGNALWSPTAVDSLTADDPLNYVRGYNTVYKAADAQGNYLGGIVDLDQGRELFAPVYAAIGLITPQRFAFARKAARSDSAAATTSPDLAKFVLVGLMDATGKVLVPPDRYISYRGFDSLNILIASAGNGTDALFDMAGHMLIAPQWRLRVSKHSGAIFGFAAQYRLGDYDVHAAYDLQGKPLFVIKRTECGAEQLQNGKGEVIWPQDATLYCGRGADDDS